MKQISKRTENIFETIIEKNLFEKVETLIEENKRNLFSEYLMLNYGLKLDTTEQINLKSTKLENQNKRSKKNGYIVKGKVYNRKYDFKRDTTETLVGKYKSKRYVSKKTEIYEALKTRRIRYEKRKVKDVACKKRIKLIDDLIVEIELFGV